MKKTLLLLAAASLTIVGCSKQDQAVNESAGAQKDRVEQAKDAQQDSLDEQKKAVSREAKFQKKQLEEQSDAQKKSIEAQADAQKAQLNAQEKQVAADASAQKAQIEANKEISDAAGAAAKEGNSDSAIEARVREAIYGSVNGATRVSTGTRDIRVSASNGVVTLKGSTPTEADKTSAEAKARSVSGVTSVDNKIEVKP